MIKDYVLYFVVGFIGISIGFVMGYELAECVRFILA